MAVELRVAQESKDDHVGEEYDAALYMPSGYAAPVDLASPGSSTTLVDQFRAEGYAAVAGLFDAVAVARAREAVDALIVGEFPDFHGIQWEAKARPAEEMTVPERRRSVRKLIYFVNHHADLFRMAYDERVLEIVRELLGDEPGLHADQALLKPPGIGREKPWHQDKAFFDIRPGAPVVGLWIALDPATVENGCMCIIPGSHISGPELHFNLRDFQICDANVNKNAIVAVPLQPGGGLFFDGLLHHGTPANQGSLMRWALQFHYAPASALYRSPEQREHYKRLRLEVFGAEGKDATC